MTEGRLSLSAITLKVSRWTTQENGYQPSAEALAPAIQIIDLLRSALHDAAACGQVHPDTATDPGMELGWRS